MIKIKQPQALTRAAMNYKTNEMRTFGVVMRHINMCLEKEKNGIVDFGLLKTPNKRNASVHSHINQKVLQNLRDNPIIIHNKDGSQFSFQLLKDYEYRPHKGNSTLYITPQAIDYLKDRSNGYIEYNYDSIFRLPSESLIRMYWLVCQFKNQKNTYLTMHLAKRIITMPDTIRSRYELPRRIKRYPDYFKKYCEVSFQVKRTLRIGKECRGWELEIIDKDRQVENRPQELSERAKILINEFYLVKPQAMKVDQFMDSDVRVARKIVKILNAIREKYQAGVIKDKGAYLVKVLRKYFKELESL